MNQTSSNNLNDNYSALGALISGHRRMKKSTFVFTVVPIICFALGIFFVIAGALTTASIKETISGLILALIFFACGMPLWNTARRERDLLLRAFADGFIYRSNKRETAVRWDEIENVYEIILSKSVNGIPVGTFYKYTLELKSVGRIKTSERLAEMETFSRTMREQLFLRLFSETIERYNTRDEVDFGEISVKKSGVTYRQKILPSNELRLTQLANGNLKIFGANGKTAWATIPLAKIPNNFVLTALLEDIFKGV